MSSGGDVVVKLLGRRNLASIPKDQQALLEGPSSWAVDVRSTSPGTVNVPNHVLETVKEAHIARISVAQQSRAKSSPKLQPQPPAQSSPSDSQKRDGGSDGSGRTPSHRNVSHTQNDDDAESPPPSSPEQSIPWSPSPERHLPVRQAVMESPIVRETPKTAPMGPPPRPLPVFSPPSSAPEEELEMELPQPQARRDPPLNGAAAAPTATAESPMASGTRVMDTPPCAQPTHPTQPVIPNTVVAEKAAPPAQRPPLEQRRRMKIIQFGDKTPKKSLAVHSRLAPTKTFTQVESSNSTSPSSVIPATFDEPTTPGPVLQSVEHVEVIDVDELDHQQSEDGIEPVIAESQVPAPMTSSNQSQGAIPDSQPPFPQISLGGDVQPYTAFKMAYPEYEETYNGDMWQFIKSCVIVEFIRGQRLLRDCIYDDFIRAFPGYLTYVNSAKSGQEPLPAIEWFSNLQGPLVFDRMVVNKANLSYILDYYPKEVASVRRIINNEPDERAVEKRRTPIHVDGAMDIDSEEPARQLSPTPTAAPANVSQVREVLTQAPPPPSPKWDSSALPSSMKTPTSKMKPPQSSQYFQRLAASAKSSSTPQRRTAEQRAKLREHFLKRKSAGVGSVASSRIRRS